LIDTATEIREMKITSKKWLRYSISGRSIYFVLRYGRKEAEMIIKDSYRKQPYPNLQLIQ